MKRKLSLLLVVVLVLSVFAGCSNGGAEADGEKVENVFVNIGTGGTVGTYFPLGGAFAEIWNNNVEGVNATAQSTGASVANINLLFDEKVEVVIVQNDIAWYAYNGKNMFDGQAFEGCTTTIL